MALDEEGLGALVKQAREEADLTQQDLADKIGLRHAQSISRYERGVTDIPVKQLRKIAELTGKPLSYFVGGDGGLTDDDRERLSAAVDRLGQVGPQLVAAARQLSEVLAGYEKTRAEQQTLAAELLAELRAAREERQRQRLE